jgi:predicted phosphodiesterase
MDIRIISDLHIDINKDYPISYNDDVFTVIAGDICGNPYDGVEWVKKNIKRGLFIKGNHQVYNKLYLPLQALTKIYADAFPLDADVSFLDDQYKIINGIVFIGCTLYTDYKFAGTQYDNMRTATVGLNDFRWGFWFDKNIQNLVPLQPQHYLKLHKKSRRFISKTLKKFKDKKCVLITHHGMSPKCIADEYVGNYLNASYVSNMERLIKSNPNLVLVISGHIHASKDFMIGNTRYIMNPYGYRNPFYGIVNTAFNPNLIMSV